MRLRTFPRPARRRHVRGPRACRVRRERRQRLRRSGGYPDDDAHGHGRRGHDERGGRSPRHARLPPRRARAPRRRRHPEGLRRRRGLRGRRALDANSVELAEAIGSVYGDEAAEQFLDGASLWRDHIRFFVDYTVALAAKDKAGQQDAVDNLIGVHGRLLRLPRRGDRTAWTRSRKVTTHVMQLKSALDAYAKGDYEKAQSLAREAYKHMIATGDTLAGEQSRSRTRACSPARSNRFPVGCESWAAAPARRPGGSLPSPGASGYRSVILENGVVRTLGPSLPKAAALAIAGERVAGGVGTHETPSQANASIWAAGASFPASRTRTSTSRPGRWRSARCGSRGPAPRRSARPRRLGGLRRSGGRWLRGLGWRSGEWSPAGEPTKEASTDNGPGARRAHVEGLPLPVAQLGGARARRRQAAGPRRRRRAQRAGRAHGVLREECAWHFRTPTSGRRRTRWWTPAGRESRWRSPAGSSRSTTRTAGSGP